MRRLRIGVVGAGFIAERHMSILAGFDDVVLAGVADVDVARAQALGRRHGVRSFDCHHELFDRCRPRCGVRVCPAVRPRRDRACGDRARARAVRGEAAGVRPVDRGGGRRRDRGARAGHRHRLPLALPGHRRAGRRPAAGQRRSTWRSAIGSMSCRRRPGGRSGRSPAGSWSSRPPTSSTWPGCWSARSPRCGAEASCVERPDFAHCDIDWATTTTLRFASGALGCIASTCVLPQPHRIGLHLFGDRLALELSETELVVGAGEERSVVERRRQPVRPGGSRLRRRRVGASGPDTGPLPGSLATHRVAIAAARATLDGAAVEL